ncbi:MAG: DUF2909 family protein [Halieaceae bacterium]|nr:DUF2909 family protein [Halieaceae bacterium]
MFLKFLIVVLLLALLASLGTGFYFLMVDQGDTRKRRLFNSLGIRLSLAVALMVVIVYGVSSGKLKSQAPWERHAMAGESVQSPADANTGDR